MQLGMNRINGDMFFIFLTMILFWLYIVPLQYKLCWREIRRAHDISYCVVQFFWHRICIKFLCSCVRELGVVFLNFFISMSQKLPVKFWLVFEIRSCLSYFLAVMLKLKGVLQSRVFTCRNDYFSCFSTCFVSFPPPPKHRNEQYIEWYFT